MLKSLTLKGDGKIPSQVQNMPGLIMIVNLKTSKKIKRRHFGGYLKKLGVNEKMFCNLRALKRPSAVINSD